ncbi:hypothetical protein C1I95_17350, partial [Micromonospora craterilacus]
MAALDWAALTIHRIALGDDDEVGRYVDEHAMVGTVLTLSAAVLIGIWAVWAGALHAPRSHASATGHNRGGVRHN